MSDAPPADGATSREAKGVGISMLTLVAQAAMPAFHLQLTNSLGLSGYGLYTTANNVADIVSVVTLFGMDAVLARKLGVALADRDEARGVRTIAAALRIVVLSGLLASAAMMLLAPWIAERLHVPALASPLRVLVLVPIAYHVASVFILATQVKMVMHYEFWTRGIFQPLSLLALTAAALASGGGVLGACIAVAGGMACTSLLAAHFYGRVYPLGGTLRDAVRQPTDRELLRLGLPLVWMNVIAALRGRIDGLYLMNYRSPEEVGAYNACLPYVATLFQVRAAFYPVILATIPALIERRDTATLNDFLRRQTRWIATLALPLFVLMVGFGDGLLAVFGSGFSRGQGALAILAVGYLLSALSVATWALPLSGNANYSAACAGAGVALQLVLPRWLIPRYGLEGAALSSALALFVSESLGLWFARRQTGAQGLSVGLLKNVLAAGAGLFAGRTVHAMVRGGVAPKFFAGVGVAAVVYVVILLALGIHAEDRALIARAVRRVRGRGA